MRTQRAVTSFWFAIAIAGTVLSSGASAQPASCTGTDHCLDVVLSGGVIQPVPDATVNGKGQWIYWTIKTSGYKFPQSPQPDGVVFKPASSGNSNGQIDGEFEQCQRRSDVVYRCKDKNNKHGDGKTYKYEYRINVVDGAGKVVSTPDPWVINK
jgi:hypothetical protein